MVKVVVFLLYETNRERGNLQVESIMEGSIKANANRRDIFLGAKDAIPIVIGFIPISVTFGMISIQSGLSLFQTFLMSCAVFAGASQLMAVHMMGMGAGIIEIILATFVLNLRHFVMSMSITNQLLHIPKAWKVCFFFGLTDETFSVASLKAREATLSRYFVTGLNATAYLSWILGTLLGGIFAHMIPQSLGAGMSIALYAMFIALLVPVVRGSWKVGVIAAVSILLNAGFSFFLNPGWSIVLATVLAALLGIVLLKEE